MSLGGLIDIGNEHKKKNSGNSGGSLLGLIPLDEKTNKKPQVDLNASDDFDDDFEMLLGDNSGLTDKKNKKTTKKSTTKKESKKHKKNKDSSSKHHSPKTSSDKKKSSSKHAEKSKNSSNKLDMVDDFTFGDDDLNLPDGKRKKEVDATSKSFPSSRKTSDMDDELAKALGIDLADLNAKNESSGENYDSDFDQSPMHGIKSPGNEKKDENKFPDRDDSITKKESNLDSSSATPFVTEATAPDTNSKGGLDASFFLDDTSDAKQNKNNEDNSVYTPSFTSSSRRSRRGAGKAQSGPSNLNSDIFGGNNDDDIFGTSKRSTGSLSTKASWLNDSPPKSVISSNRNANATIKQESKSSEISRNDSSTLPSQNISGLDKSLSSENRHQNTSSSSRGGEVIEANDDDIFGLPKRNNKTSANASWLNDSPPKLVDTSGPNKSSQEPLIDEKKTTHTDDNRQHSKIHVPILPTPTPDESVEVNRQSNVQSNTIVNSNSTEAINLPFTRAKAELSNDEKMRPPDNLKTESASWSLPKWEQKHIDNELEKKNVEKSIDDNTNPKLNIRSNSSDALKGTRKSQPVEKSSPGDPSLKSRRSDRRSSSPSKEHLGKSTLDNSLGNAHELGLKLSPSRIADPKQKQSSDQNSRDSSPSPTRLGESFFKETYSDKLGKSSPPPSNFSGSRKNSPVKNTTSAMFNTAEDFSLHSPSRSPTSNSKPNWLKTENDEKSHSQNTTTIITKAPEVEMIQENSPLVSSPERLVNAATMGDMTSVAIAAATAVVAASEGNMSPGKNTMKNMAATLTRQHEAEILAVKAQEDAKQQALCVEHNRIVDRLKQEKLELERKIVQLTEKLGIKEEELSQEKCKSDLAQTANEKRWTERINLLNELHSKELTSRKEQFDDALASFKRMYADDNRRSKEQIEEREELQRLVFEVRTATGKMKALQEQISLQKVDTEARIMSEDGSRSRILVEMESSCKAYALRSQDECNKLKDILSSMEITMKNMRGQNFEEKERMKSDKLQLEDLTLCFQSETQLLRDNLKAERDMLQQKYAHFIQDKKTFEARLLRQKEELDMERKSLDSERIQFSLQEENIRNLEGNLKLENAREVKRLELEKDKLELKKQYLDKKALNLEEEIIKYRIEKEAFDSEVLKLQQQKNDFKKVVEQVHALSEELKEKKRQCDEGIMYAEELMAENTRIRTKLEKLDHEMNQRSSELDLKQQNFHSARVNFTRKKCTEHRQASLSLHPSNFNQYNSNLKETKKMIESIVDSKREDKNIDYSNYYSPFRPETIEVDPSGINREFRVYLDKWNSGGDLDSRNYLQREKLFLASFNTMNGPNNSKVSNFSNQTTNIKPALNDHPAPILKKSTSRSTNKVFSL